MPWIGSSSACARPAPAPRHLAATHSPALVDRLRQEELIVCEREVETGASRIPAISAAGARRMFAEDELRLGELWFSGALGGVI